jgi:C1A family cysteine protease
MKKTIEKVIKTIGFFILAILLFVSCDKGAGVDAQDGKLMDGKVNLLDPGRYGCAEFSTEYLKSIDYTTPDEYRAKLASLRPDLSATQRSAAVASLMPSSYNLPAQPIGDQGSEGSCVGWGVGYTAHGITRYINNTAHQYNWSSASRSAAYVYNQIKIYDCGSGSYPNDAMNLIKNQGQCSNTQMPYVAGGCYIQPTTQQRIWASERKSNGWFYVNPTSVDNIRYYLSQNYPVAACFDVNQSFYDSRYYNYVWSSLYGARQGGHCVCIVGYNDTTRQFKVQNSWGSGWGRSGYFYITYDNVARGALNWTGCILHNPAANNPQY